MSQRIVPYLVDNVAYIRPRREYVGTGPDETAIRYGYTPDQKPLAKVVQLSAAKKKTDGPQP